MPHTFDTGLDKPQRTKIRDAIIARLAPLKRAANPALYIPANGIKTVSRPFRGAGDVEMRGELAKTFQGLSPAIAIGIGRAAFGARGVSAIEAEATIEIGIYVASSHSRDIVEGRLYGDATAAAANTNDPGLFVLLEHVRQLLLGQELDIEGVGPLRPVEEDEVATFDDLTIWEQRYEVAVDVEINPFRAITQTVTEIEGRHSLSDIPDGHALDPLVTTLADLEP